MELCEANGYYQTIKLMDEKFGGHYLKQKLENFTKFKKSRKCTISQAKLSFEVILIALSSVNSLIR